MAERRAKNEKTFIGTEIRTNRDSPGKIGFEIEP